MYIQILLAKSAGQIGVVFMVHTAICGGEDRKLFAEMVSAYIFASGLGTVLEVTFGIRQVTVDSNFPDTC